MPLIDGESWDEPTPLARVPEAAGADAWLDRTDPSGRFDVLPLLVATDGAIAEFGRDGRRLRPNIVIGGVEGLDERAWPGKILQIADVEIDLDSMRARCPMTTVAPTPSTAIRTSCTSTGASEATWL